MILSNMKWSPEKYAESSVLYNECGKEMLARLDWMTLAPKVIIDAGCGIGELSADLQVRYPDAHILAIDASLPMLEHPAPSQKTARICADATNLPVTNASVDLLAANFLLPWHAQLQKLFHEWHRVLCPEGLITFTSLGPDSLRELRPLCETAAIIPRLIDMHDIGDMLVQEGFADPVLDVEYYTLSYREKQKLINEMCALGILHNDAVLADCTEWSITFEIIHGHAWKPEKNGFAPDSDGIARIPVSSLRR